MNIKNQKGFTLIEIMIVITIIIVIVSVITCTVVTVRQVSQHGLKDAITRIWEGEPK